MAACVVTKGEHVEDEEKGAEKETLAMKTTAARVEFLDMVEMVYPVGFQSTSTF